MTWRTYGFAFRIVWPPLPSTWKPTAISREPGTSAFQPTSRWGSSSDTHTQSAVSGSTIRFARAGLVPWRGALVLALVAAPLAFLGGLTPIRQSTFLLLLGLSLVLAGLALLLPRSPDLTGQPTKAAKWVGLAVAPLGYLAGLVGIGGGIFLAPLLHLTRWNRARQIAATTSLFILVNSLAGLLGQLAKNGPDRLALAVASALPLVLAVILGGQIGSLLAQRLLPEQVIRWLTAALTIWAGTQLLLR